MYCGMMTPKDVRVLRAELNISRSELGRRVGRSARQVLNYETEGTEIPLMVELAFAAVAAGILEYRGTGG